MTSSRRLLIVGAGFSGTATAWHVLRRARSALEIVLVERDPRQFARGVAYSTFDPAHLLNVPAGRMSVDPASPDDFASWLVDHGLAHASSASDVYASRQSYGQYLEQRLREAGDAAIAGVTLQRTVAEAVAADPAASGWNVTLADGRVLAGDVLVLALGNFPPSNPRIQDPRGFDSPRYYDRAWKPGAVDGIGAEEEVLLLGTGLTAVDMVVSLIHSGHRGTIHAVSRHGLWPLMQAGSGHWREFLPDPPPARTATLFALVRAEMAHAQARGAPWPAVVHSLRPRTPGIWQALPLAEQQRFLRHVRPWWEVARHRMPTAAATIVADAISKGRLQTFCGRLRTLVDTGDALAVGLDVRGRPVSLRVARVLNCTGPESNHRRLNDPLVRDLLARGLVHPDPLHLGLSTDANGRLEDAAGGTPHALYTLGPCRKGSLWETTAVPEIREQAVALADLLVRDTVSSA